MHEDMIAKAKEQITSRNPEAFKPKFNDDEVTSRKSSSLKHQRG